MKLTEDIINDVRNSASISEVIGHYIPLIKKGKGYTALCPFHDDHDPSLSISEDKQIFKCFVCGAGGNAFNFVKNFKKISFPEAVVEVAEISGKHLDIDLYKAPKKIDKNQKYYDVLNKYIEQTNYLLTSTNAGLKAMEYLTSRGMNKDIINKFDIGFNPSEDFMYKYLHQNECKDEDLITTGIARMADRGMRDIFYNRITFPIHNKDGNPIAFTARDFTGSSDSKYINTSETLIYTKGNNLYNYHRAKEAAKRVNNIIIVEGTMDVIAYYRAGIENVVSTLGTALTNNQLELIRSITNNVVLSFDGDKAGKVANMKHGEVLLSNGFNVEVVDNRSEYDPDEIVSKQGINALKDMTSHKLSYIDFAINFYKDLYNLNNYADRKAMTIKVSSLIEKLPDQYDKDNYENTLFELTKIKKVQTSVNKKEYNIQGTKDYHYSIDGLTKAEYSILVMISMSYDALNIYQKDLGYLLDETCQKLAMIIIDEYRKHKECKFSKLLDEVDDENVTSLITLLATLDNLPEKYDKDLLMSAIAKVKLEIKKQKLLDLQEKVKKTDIVDPEQSLKYLKEYQELVRELGGRKDG